MALPSSDSSASEFSITLQIEAGFGTSGMSESEAVSWAIKQFLDELKEGRGIEKMHIIIDRVIP
jgi:hypothetical protein